MTLTDFRNWLNYKKDIISEYNLETMTTNSTSLYLTKLILYKIDNDVEKLQNAMDAIQSYSRVDYKNIEGEQLNAISALSNNFIKIKLTPDGQYVTCDNIVSSKLITILIIEKYINEDEIKIILKGITESIREQEFENILINYSQLWDKQYGDIVLNDLKIKNILTLKETLLSTTDKHLENKLKHLKERRDNCQREMLSISKEIINLEYRRLGIDAYNKNKNEQIDEFIDYILKYKIDNIKEVYCIQDTIYITLQTPLHFDIDVYEQIKDNIDLKLTKVLLENIKNNKIIANICATFRIALSQNYIEINDRHVSDSKTLYNPHLHPYECFGDNMEQIITAMENRQLISLIEILNAVTGQINILDNPVMARLEEKLQYMNQKIKHDWLISKENNANLTIKNLQMMGENYEDNEDTEEEDTIDMPF